MIKTCLLFVLLKEALAGSGDEHVHFKIHVPEIIKHHIHTKTVFIHLHDPKVKPKKEKPKIYHHVDHHEDWSSWSSYDHHEDKDYKDYDKKYYKDKEQDDKDKKYKDYKNYGYDHQKDHDYKDHKDQDHKDQYNSGDLYDHKDSYFPQPVSYDGHDHLQHLNGDDHGMIGYSYPPQYSVHEKVEENPEKFEPYMNHYEEGYRKGFNSETAKTFMDEYTKFHDNKHEEGQHSEEGYKEEGKEEEGKTNAGRYFVEEEEEESEEDKNKRKRRRRRNERIPIKIIRG